MSSLLNSLDMSLDDLIQKKKTSNSGKGRDGRKESSGAGPVRRGRANAGRGRSSGTPYGNRKNDDDDVDMNDNKPAGRKGKELARVVESDGRVMVASILSRIGGKAQASEEGVKIFVSNLKHDVLEEDIKELFATVGKVIKHELLTDRSGRSKGQARVWFSNKRAAEAAVNKYDGCTLDNQPMKITLDESPSQGGRGGNKSENANRGGLFGTALKGVGGDDVDFQVTFNGNRGNGGRRGGRGGDRRGRGGRGNKASAADLDDDMDTYMSKN
ncbi:hypothetical protein ACHHYP_12129 [Achlya hypogyna]|uniref:RRM domain-containing protein n=1 Tax=Achlya hypogyna TaxID=1202772 RepID=A0A1V9ZH63_ACHHY|nr:hypothetical protein ACHHYP_12129 [Achlya hypogyna]